VLGKDAVEVDAVPGGMAPDVVEGAAVRPVHSSELSLSLGSEEREPVHTLGGLS
jgi:hypothetical protein